MKAQICPVCSGEGKYKNKECHGCNGKGWVEVREDYYPTYPVIPYYPHPYDPYPYYPCPYQGYIWYTAGDQLGTG